jgi:hypothetical protein
MADTMLADELRITSGVTLVDADDPGRERIAKPLVAGARKAQDRVRAQRLV